jgi:hypothetical protein
MFTAPESAFTMPKSITAGYQNVRSRCPKWLFTFVRNTHLQTQLGKAGVFRTQWIDKLRKDNTVIPTEPLPAPYGVSARDYGRALGRQIADNPACRIVMLADTHSNISHWEVAVGMAEGLNEKKCTRQLIYAFESMPEPYADQCYKKWNQKEQLSTNAFRLMENVFPTEYCEKQLALYNNSPDLNESYASNAAKYHAINKLAAITPSSKFVGDIDCNHPFKRNELREEDRAKCIDRDTAMAMKIDALAVRHPNALIIVPSMGAYHVTKNIAGDGSSEVPKMTGMSPEESYLFWSNPQDRVIEQLASIYGVNNVLNYRVITDDQTTPVWQPEVRATEHSKYVPAHFDLAPQFSLDENFDPITVNRGHFDGVIKTPSMTQRGKHWSPKSIE